MFLGRVEKETVLRTHKSWGNYAFSATSCAHLCIQEGNSISSKRGSNHTQKARLSLLHRAPANQVSIPSPAQGQVEMNTSLSLNHLPIYHGDKTNQCLQNLCFKSTSNSADTASSLQHGFYKWLSYHKGCQRNSGLEINV